MTVNQFTTQDGFIFIDTLFNIPNGKHYVVASFDVTSLFTNVPLEETIDNILNLMFIVIAHGNGSDRI